MLEIAHLAAGAVSAIVPYLIKGSEAVAEGIGGSLWNWLTSKFKDKGEKEVLDKLAQNPKDAETIGEAKATLKGILKENTNLVTELAVLVDAVKATQVMQTKHNEVNVEGDNNFTPIDIVGSTITFNSNTPPKA